MPPNPLFYLQAPAGNRTSLTVCRTVRGAPPGLTGVPGWRPYWFGSGTMALAAALAVARSRTKQIAPRVVLAAYGCPDLVAAIRFVGAEPLYVDVDRDRFCMASGGLAEAAARDDVMAVIGVDLFGFPEQWNELRAIAGNRLLIQDCAQSVQPAQLRGARLDGDVCVFSFGRGKPVCLLGGGALLVRDSLGPAAAAALAGSITESSPYDPRGLSLRVAAYNGLLHPFLYRASAAVLGSRLGRTVYEPLTAIRGSSPRFAAAADGAVAAYCSAHRDRTRELVRALTPVLTRYGQDVALSLAPDDGALEGRVLQRLPILIRSPSVRDEFIAMLRARGVMATRMYEKALPEIVGTGTATDAGRYDAARRVADELVTLPVHSRLTSRDIEAIVESLESALRMGFKAP